MDGIYFCFDDLPGFGLIQMEMMRGFNAGADIAFAALFGDQHGLTGFVATSGLRTKIICGCQGQQLSVPERGVVSSMVVSVAAKHVKDHTREKLPKC